MDVGLKCTCVCCVGVCAVDSPLRLPSDPADPGALPPRADPAHPGGAPHSHRAAGAGSTWTQHTLTPSQMMKPTF